MRVTKEAILAFVVLAGQETSSFVLQHNVAAAVGRPHQQSALGMAGQVPDPPFFSNQDPDPNSPGDKFRRKAYDDWRRDFGKGEFDPVRYEHFKINYATLMDTNAAAAAKAKKNGDPEPELKKLNEFGDCSREEVEDILARKNQGLPPPPPSSEKPDWVRDFKPPPDPRMMYGGPPGMSGFGADPNFAKEQETFFRKAYDDWRKEFKKGDFDAERFENFKINIDSIIQANESAFAMAMANGTDPPKPQKLNEYGDCSAEEYQKVLVEQGSSASEAPWEVGSDFAKNGWQNGGGKFYANTNGPMEPNKPMEPNGPMRGFPQTPGGWGNTQSMMGNYDGRRDNMSDISLPQRAKTSTYGMLGDYDGRRDNMSDMSLPRKAKGSTYEMLGDYDSRRDNMSDMSRPQRNKDPLYGMRGDYDGRTDNMSDMARPPRNKDPLHGMRGDYDGRTDNMSDMSRPPRNKASTYGMMDNYERGDNRSDMQASTSSYGVPRSRDYNDRPNGGWTSGSQRQGFQDNNFDGLRGNAVGRMGDRVGGMPSTGGMPMDMPPMPRDFEFPEDKENARYRQVYEDWCKENGREPDDYRFDIFVGHYRRAEEVMKDSGEPVTLNGYADYTTEEYEEVMKQEKSKKKSKVPTKEEIGGFNGGMLGGFDFSPEPLEQSKLEEDASSRRQEAEAKVNARFEEARAKAEEKARLRDGDKSKSLGTDLKYLWDEEARLNSKIESTEAGLRNVESEMKELKNMLGTIRSQLREKGGYN